MLKMRYVMSLGVSFHVRRSFGQGLGGGIWRKLCDGREYCYFEGKTGDVWLVFRMGTNAVARWRSIIRGGFRESEEISLQIVIS